VLCVGQGCLPTVARAMVVNAAQLASYSQAKQLVMSTGITFLFAFGKLLFTSYASCFLHAVYLAFIILLFLSFDSTINAQLIHFCYFNSQVLCLSLAGNF